MSRASERSPTRTIVIGDVHGCLSELEALLALVEATPQTDRIVLVGDLVAKGPDSQGVIQLCRERGLHAVLGNHDAKLLSLEGEATKTSEAPTGSHAQIASTLCQADWDYLRALPLWVHVSDMQTIVVHAGLVPGLPLDQQPRRFLLNLRSITPDGQPSKRIEDGVPWAQLWTGPQHVVFGHDAVRGLQQHPFATGLDSGCVYGGALTALILPERKLVSVPARRAYANTRI